MAAVNRFYSSNAMRTTIISTITSTATTVTVGATTGFPGSTPFTLVLDEGQVLEEIVTVTGVAGTTLTVVRGVDGTTGVAHSTGASVVHALTARDLREPQEHIAATSGVHGLTGAPAEASTLLAHTAAISGVHGATGQPLDTGSAQGVTGAKTMTGLRIADGIRIQSSTGASNLEGQSLYSEGGALKWRSSAGTITVIVPSN